MSCDDVGTYEVLWDLLRAHYIHVVLEGNIGVGKTTYAQKLHKSVTKSKNSYIHNLCIENVARFTNFNGVDLLQQYYDRELSLDVLQECLFNIQTVPIGNFDAHGGVHVWDRLPKVSSIGFSKLDPITPQRRVICETRLRSVIDLFTPVFKDSFMIVHATRSHDFTKLLQNIHSRGRPSEQNITSDYLRDVEDIVEYNAFCLYPEVAARCGAKAMAIVEAHDDEDSTTTIYFNDCLHKRDQWMKIDFKKMVNFPNALGRLGCMLMKPVHRRSTEKTAEGGSQKRKKPTQESNL